MGLRRQSRLRPDAIDLFDHGQTQADGCAGARGDGFEQRLRFGARVIVVRFADRALQPVGQAGVGGGGFRAQLGDRPIVLRRDRRPNRPGQQPGSGRATLQSGRRPKRGQRLGRPSHLEGCSPPVEPRPGVVRIERGGGLERADRRGRAAHADQGQTPIVFGVGRTGIDLQGALGLAQRNLRQDLLPRRVEDVGRVFPVRAEQNLLARDGGGQPQLEAGSRQGPFLRPGVSPDDPSSIVQCQLIAGQCFGKDQLARVRLGELGQPAWRGRPHPRENDGFVKQVRAVERSQERGIAFRQRAPERFLRPRQIRRRRRRHRADQSGRQARDGRPEPVEELGP